MRLAGSSGLPGPTDRMGLGVEDDLPEVERRGRRVEQIEILERLGEEETLHVQSGWRRCRVRQRLPQRRPAPARKRAATTQSPPPASRGQRSVAAMNHARVEVVRSRSQAPLPSPHAEVKPRRDATPRSRHTAPQTDSALPFGRWSELRRACRSHRTRSRFHVPAAVS